ncbi:MAG: flagellar hook-associated protein FlgK [Rhodospirillaceae bacterium]|nr:flagellar hook-associated protein FlgK [Rhodospirillaceae bacterium]
MSLTTSLLHARSGMIAAQSGLDVVSRNIANAETEGYTKKSHNQENLIIGGVGRGVQTTEVSRKVNDNLQREVRDQNANIEKLKILDEFLGRLELEFGKPGDKSSIADKVSGLKRAFQTLSATPESASSKIALVTAADTLARSFNSFNDLLQDLRAEADNRISGFIDAINSDLELIKGLNEQIGQRTAAEKSTADLEDKRDQLLLSVNKNVSIGSFKRSNNRLTISTADGRLMLDDTQIPMAFSATSSFTAATTGNGVTLGGADISAGIKSRDGVLSGLLTLRDTVLPQFQTKLDDLALEIAKQLDVVAVAGSTEALNLFTDAAGNAPAAFTPADNFTNGFAGTIRVRAALKADPSLVTDPTGGLTVLGSSDNRLQLAILALFEGQTSLSQAPTVNNTLEGFAAALVGDVATSKAEYDTQLKFQNVFRDQLRDRFENESGVNTDEELTNLITLEAAFGASARVLNAVQRAFDEVISIL